MLKFSILRLRFILLCMAGFLGLLAASQKLNLEKELLLDFFHLVCLIGFVCSLAWEQDCGEPPEKKP